MDAQKIQTVLDALKAANVLQANKATSSDAADKKSAVTKEAYGKAAGLADKAHKAAGALHEHMSGMADAEHEGAAGMRDTAKEAHKTLGGLSEKAHKAAGMEMPKESEAEKAFGFGAEAMKALGEMQAKLDLLERTAYQPRAAGAGAGLTVAKGETTHNTELARKAVGDMTASERDLARKAAFSRAMQVPIAADRFAGVSMDTLRAADEVLELAGQSGEPAR